MPALAIAIQVLKWLRDLLTNPVVLAVLAAIAIFFAGYYTHSKIQERKTLETSLDQQSQAVQSLITKEVKYEKIHHKYASVKSDTVRDLERLLSYEVCENCTSKDKPADNAGLSSGKDLSDKDGKVMDGRGEHKVGSRQR